MFSPNGEGDKPNFPSLERRALNRCPINCQWRSLKIANGLTTRGCTHVVPRSFCDAAALSTAEA
jgi:hypothetical protein